MTWLTDTLFKMTWLNDLMGWLLITLFGMDESSTLFQVMQFFLYDVIKIFILLCVLIFIVSFIQSYFSPERSKRILQPLKGIWGNTTGALLGTLTPFCSCSSIPLFIGFTKAGLPIGITFSFLISSPLVDLASVILLGSIFGWPVALLYVVVGLIIAIGGGTLMQALNMERYLEAFVRQPARHLQEDDADRYSTPQRVAYAWGQVKEVFLRVYPYVLIGVAIGALIHGVIPPEWIHALLGQDQWFAVPLATFIGVPFYADIFGTLPIAESLLNKGVGVGTILSFMMAVTALSLPSMMMLKKVMKPRLLITFVLYLIVSIMTMGFFFNALMG